MSIARIVMTAAAMAVLASSTRADPVSGSPAALSEDQASASTYQTKRAEADMVWALMPMSAQKALLVSYDSSGYGDYDPRPNSDFKGTEKVFSYIEPIGFVFKETGGLYTYGYTVDLTAKRADGTILFQKQKYASLNSKSRAKKYESSFASALGIGGLEPGKYTLDFIFRDINSDKAMKVVQTFTIVN